MNSSRHVFHRGSPLLNRVVVPAYEAVSSEFIMVNISEKMLPSEFAGAGSGVAQQGNYGIKRIILRRILRFLSNCGIKLLEMWI